MARYDEHPPAEIFPGITNPLSTGAPGTPGISATGTAGPVVGSPVIRSPFSSSQAPGDRIDVHAGDTSSFSDDRPVHGSPLLADPAGASVTGSGTGHTLNKHPNAGQ